MHIFKSPLFYFILGLFFVSGIFSYTLYKKYATKIDEFEAILEQEAGKIASREAISLQQSPTIVQGGLQGEREQALQGKELQEKLIQADTYRKMRGDLTGKAADQRAVDLYQSLIEAKNVPANLKAKAKINLANMHLERRVDVMEKSHQTQALNLYKDVIDDASVDRDLRGWAQRKLANLYFTHKFNLEPNKATSKAIELLEEILKDKEVSPDTKARVKRDLATIYLGYINWEFQDKEKARTLLLEVKNDREVSLPVRIKVILFLIDRYAHNLLEPSLEELKGFKDKVHYIKYVMNDLSNDSEIEPEMKGEIRWRLAIMYQWNLFNETPSEARRKALDMMNAVVTDETLPLSIRLRKKEKLAVQYVYNFFDFNQSEAESYKRRGVEILEALARDPHIDLDRRIDIRLKLARMYLNGLLPLSPGESGKEAGLNLYQEILKDPEAGAHKKAEARFALAVTYLENRIHFPRREARKEALKLLEEIREDPSSRFSEKDFAIKAIARLKKEKK